MYEERNIQKNKICVSSLEKSRYDTLIGIPILFSPPTHSPARRQVYEYSSGVSRVIQNWWGTDEEMIGDPLFDGWNRWLDEWYKTEITIFRSIIDRLDHILDVSFLFDEAVLNCRDKIETLV